MSHFPSHNIRNICIIYDHGISYENVLNKKKTWWCHDLDMRSAFLALCEGNPPGILTKDQECRGWYFLSSWHEWMLNRQLSRRCFVTQWHPCDITVMLTRLRSGGGRRSGGRWWSGGSRHRGGGGGGGSGGSGGSCQRIQYGPIITQSISSKIITMDTPPVGCHCGFKRWSMFCLGSVQLCCIEYLVV